MNCIFNGHNLHSGNYQVSKTDATNAPDSIVNKYQLVRADGEVVTAKYYGERLITVNGYIKATSVTDMEQKIDVLKGYLTGKNKVLSITVAGAERIFTATASGLSLDIVGCSCKWVIQFAASAFGKDAAATSLAVTSPYITSPQNNAFTFGGTYNARPMFDFTVNMVEPFWESATLNIENVALSKKISITRSWSLMDRVIINAEEKTCQIYPTLKTLIDSCDFADEWTSSHTLSLDTVNKKEGVAALKAVMAAPAAVVSFNRLNSGTLDLSAAMGKIILPIFIPTPTAGAVASVSLYIGKNATLAADYDYWTVSTQWNGAALATNAWNYVIIDLAAAVTGTNGTPDRTAISSISIRINGTAATMQLNGLLLDYISLQKASVTAVGLDYQGIFPEYEVGTGTIKISDDFTSRNITISSNYTKRYL